VDLLSIWQFGAAVDGWVEANCPPEKGKLTEQDRDELWQMVQEEEG
jgi:hypothetical protein